MFNFSKLEYSSRYHDWYHGYTQVQFPYHNGEEFLYFENTYAASGNITTKYFGEKFDAAKIDDRMKIDIGIRSPDSLENETDTILFFKIVKNTLRELSDKDKMNLNSNIIDADLTHYNANLTDLNSNGITVFRTLSKEDLIDIDQDFMPGFNLVWLYDREVESQNYYSNSNSNREFVR